MHFSGQGFKGSSRDPEGGLGGEGMGVLDRETLSGSLLGMMPCFPLAGPLALRLAVTVTPSQQQRHRFGLAATRSTANQGTHSARSLQR